ncbi:MAG: ATPase, T2SS/T4P/T4SS family [Actinomycetes bacterium]
MTAIAQITELARSMLSDSKRNLEVDKAISDAVDLVYEEGFPTHNWDETHIRKQVQRSLTGYGSLEEILEDSAIEEIWINRPGQVFIHKNSQTSILPLDLDALAVRQTVEKMLRDSGRRLDRSEPFVDATLFDGSRLHVVIPDVTKNHWAVNIRRFPESIRKLADLVAANALTYGTAEFIKAEFQSGSNILVSGATQAGKTTILCALLEESHPQDRLISIEETFEVRTNHPDWVALQTRQANLEGVGEISLRRLVREALRMRPTRLVIGEVRQAEALDLLIALNSGIAGICTIHANSAIDAIEKLKLLPLLAGENIPAKFVSKTVERNIDIVVHAQVDRFGHRRISEVLVANRSNHKTKWEERTL